MQTKVHRKCVLDNALQSLARRVHEEGMQLQSLSEMQLATSTRQQCGSCSCPSADSIQQIHDQSVTERVALESQMSSLKTLMCALESPAVESADEDWRGTVLEAVQSFLVEERGLALVEAREMVAATSSGAPDLAARLDSRLRQLELEQRLALDKLSQADRTSLLEEMAALRRRVSRAEMDLRRETERADEAARHATDIQCGLQQRSVDQMAAARHSEILENRLTAAEHHSEEARREMNRIGAELRQARQAESAAAERTAAKEAALLEVRRDLARLQQQNDLQSDQLCSLT